jgi:CPA2 family monovalent cation:H+ antiporter-2
LSHQAAADALPMRDAFAVLFFLSVGMLFDPRLLLDAPDQILAVLGIVMIGKAAAAVPLVLLLGWPLRTALTVGAGLAQIGEFSFIVMTLGRSLGLVSERAYQLVIAGALLSITLNPLMFRVIDPLEAWLRRRALLSALRERRAGALTRLPAEVDEESLHDHAVIIGYGRVGSLIGELLEQRGLPRVVVELNQRRVEELRRHGVPAIYGDAANPSLLTHVHLDRARVLLVAIPDAPAARLIVEYAHAIRPDLDIIVRTHSESEWNHMRERVSEAVLGEREAALEMAGYTLRRFGVSGEDVQSIVEELRGRARLGEEDSLPPAPEPV